MAKLRFNVSSKVTPGSTNANHTVLALTAPTNQQVAIEHFSAYSQGVTPTDTPVNVSVISQTAGTGSGSSAVTPVKLDDSSATIQSTATKGYTAEPTGSSVIWQDMMQPQLGNGISLPISQEWIIPGGGQFGVVINVPAGNLVPIMAQFIAEE